MKISELYNIFLNNPNISTDSRTIKNGDIFWALKGDNFDGSQYVNLAIQKGASFAITDNTKYLNKKKCIVVENSLISLQELAAFHRKKLKIPIIAITGTNGKTTTKELITHVLLKKYKVKSTTGNFNNHIGVPLTLLSFDKTTKIGVVEMGANHPGEIETLCNIAVPDYGLITNIGKAHLKGFGSFNGLINTKKELYQSIEKNKGIIFLNEDNKLLTNLLASQKTVNYGTNKNVFCKGKLIASDPFVNIIIDNVKIKSKLIGSFNFENILAAACIGKYFKIEINKIKQAIENYIPENNRSQIIKKDSLNIILDAYNANPTSMSLAIDNFINIKQENKVLILGDMFELGEYAQEEHTNILKKLVKLKQKNNKTRIYIVGNIFRSVYSEKYQNENIESFQTTDELINNLSNIKFNKSWFLIKGSRGMKLEETIKYINAH
ncbi:MAG: UDP-N-acetylmuramoyl-tripeptide--D-alanyl-D-alanine ligase [Bacteroidales bacterium]|nr:UDP-N-acetylmuramoyl-tripeptide--D-alanyl-D-alanine ligase [Bacteroidales bacterium]